MLKIYEIQILESINWNFCLHIAFDCFYSTYINAILPLPFASIIFTHDGWSVVLLFGLHPELMSGEEQQRGIWFNAESLSISPPYIHDFSFEWYGK